MLLLSILDILSLSINSVATGVFNVLGISFCQFPFLIFLYGSVGESCWMSGSACSVLLAIERCVEINPNFPLEFVFRKKVFYFVLGALVGYSFWSLLFTKPVLFSVEYSCWFFDPMTGENVRFSRTIKSVK